MPRQGFQKRERISEVIEHSEAKGEPESARAEIETRVEVLQFELRGRTEQRAERLEPQRPIEVCRRVLDRRYAASERFEEERKSAVAASDVEHGRAVDEREQIAALIAQHGFENVKYSERVVRIPARPWRYTLALDSIQAIVKLVRQRYELADVVVWGGTHSTMISG